ncbi:hypothetical protein ZWY2020_041388 [Hordeum vulgare]|nr:hypothetical protein ZWY2020_041388 [Hordeum vulgare]
MSAALATWIIVAAKGCISDRFNRSTSIMSKGQSIKASLFAKPPPQSSKSWVNCPADKDDKEIRILCVAGDLIVFCFAKTSSNKLTPIRKCSCSSRSLICLTVSSKKARSAFSSKYAFVPLY